VCVCDQSSTIGIYDRVHLTHERITTGPLSFTTRSTDASSIGGGGKDVFNRERKPDARLRVAAIDQVGEVAIQPDELFLYRSPHDL